MDIARYERLWSRDWQAVQAVGPLTHTRYRLLSELLPADLPDAPAIIDVGCGNGTFLAFLHRILPGARLVGVEPTVAGRESADPSIRPCIRTGTLEQLLPELPKADFDVAICSEVLEHVLDPVETLRGIHALLKPGAVALLTVPAGRRHWSSQDEAAGHLRRFEFDEFGSLLVQTGFDRIEQYGWGGPIATIYNRLVSAAGPERVAKSGSRAGVRLASRALTALFRIDDRYRSPGAFQLIAAARRPRG